jgi:cell division protein FtsI (penicillin-binding protein 3)
LKKLIKIVVSKLKIMLNIKNEVLVRVYIVAAVVTLVAVAIFFRLYQLAIIDAERWIQKANDNYVKLVDVRADRGNILADDGSLLATSLPFFNIHFDAKAEGLTDEVFNQNLDSLAWLLATTVNKEYTPGAYRDWLIQLRMAADSVKGIRYMPIANNVAYSKMLQIKDFPLFRLGRHKGGLIVEQMPKRERPFKMLAQRTIGYVREGALPVGLEGSYDNVLGGSLGKQLMLRVPGDVYIPMNDLAEIEPLSGNDIVTTLDINIQDATENALLRACERHNADHGTAIVMEVKTGKIRSIANIGRTPDGWWETYNYGVGQRVEPGSMFKLASFMAMFEDGYINDFQEKVAVHKGKVKFYDEELVDAEPHGLDTMTMEQVFAKSSNVGTASLITRHYGTGKKALDFTDRLKTFGLNMPTGIDVDGEEEPIVKEAFDKKAGWSGTSLPWMSIGYELLLTPLQMLQFYNAVANDGKMMKPYLVQRVEQFGETVREFNPIVVKKSIASKNTIKKVQHLLEMVVDSSYGTAHRIQAPNYKIAGKTGTAQLNYHKYKVSAGLRHQAAFCGYFPAENPIYSCIVVISEPKSGGYHGAEVAAPVFRAIADKCFAMKADLHPAVNAGAKPMLATTALPNIDAGTQKDIKDALKWLKLDWYEPFAGTSFFSKSDKITSEWVVLKAQRDTLSMLNRTIPDKTVPSVVGMGLKDAIYLLENRGCKVRADGVGKVKRQSIAPGSTANGQTITVWLD